jgi:hypothetical protein
MKVNASDPKISVAMPRRNNGPTIRKTWRLVILAANIIVVNVGIKIKTTSKATTSFILDWLASHPKRRILWKRSKN